MPPTTATKDQYVIGEAAKYWTPSLELADRALTAVCTAIKRTKDPTQLARLRRDLDLILDRRWVLEWNQELIKKA